MPMPILARTRLATSSLVLVLLVPLVRPALSFSPPPIPLNWTAVLPCASDTPARVLTNVRTHTLANNTPAACIALCAAAPSPTEYTYAGVEYADECHCGTGLASPEAAPAAECDMPCAGDADLACGGPWRIQVRAAHPSLHVYVPLSPSSPSPSPTLRVPPNLRSCGVTFAPLVLLSLEKDPH